MKRLAFIAVVISCALSLRAQVAVTTPIHFTGTQNERAVDSLAYPSDASSLVTVEGSVRAGWLWATAQVQGNSIELVVSPAVASYRDGLLLRFQSPADLNGVLTVGTQGLAHLPLLRPDGLPPVLGQIRTGVVCEVMQVQGRFVLMNASEFGCPPGSVPVNDHLCIGTGTVSNLLYYEAVDLCANLGGNLCTWDEYYTACVVAQNQLTSLFNNWEWLDDTSNHTHTANQAGRLTCKSQRTESLLDEREGEARCCFHLR